MKRLSILFWPVMATIAWLMPDSLPLLTQMLIMGLFAVSLDLALGVAGILTVGHAAFFGVGAYTAGLLAVHGWGEPLSGLLLAALVCALLGYVLAFLIIPGSDLMRLMITVAVCLLFAEAARQFSSITGGADGLLGMDVWPVLGRYEFDLFGLTAFTYTFVVVLVLFTVACRILQSPFGYSLAGIRQNPQRMWALGVPVGARLRQAFALSGALAGVAGALLAQTTQFVGVDTLSFERSAEVLIMLVLGGTGHLVGGLVGATVYILVRDQLAIYSPQYWMLGMGLVLIAVALSGGGGLMGWLSRHRRWREQA